MGDDSGEADRLVTAPVASVPSVRLSDRISHGLRAGHMKLGKRFRRFATADPDNGGRR